MLGKPSLLMPSGALELLLKARSGYLGTGSELFRVLHPPAAGSALQCSPNDARLRLSERLLNPFLLMKDAAYRKKK